MLEIFIVASISTSLAADDKEESLAGVFIPEYMPFEWERIQQPIELERSGY